VSIDHTELRLHTDVRDITWFVLADK